MKKALLVSILLLLFPSCAQSQGPIEFEKGQLVHVKFTRPMETAEGTPISAYWLKYRFQIRDTTVDSLGWFDIFPDPIPQSFDEITFTKKTSNLITNHTYRHRVQAIIDPRQFLYTRVDTLANDSLRVVEVYAEGASAWAETEEYIVVDSTTSSPADTLYIPPRDIDKATIF